MALLITSALELYFAQKIICGTLWKDLKRGEDVVTRMARCTPLDAVANRVGDGRNACQQHVRDLLVQMECECCNRCLLHKCGGISNAHSRHGSWSEAQAFFKDRNWCQDTERQHRYYSEESNRSTNLHTTLPNFSVFSRCL